MVEYIKQTQEPTERAPWNNLNTSQYIIVVLDYKWKYKINTHSPCWYKYVIGQMNEYKE